MLKKFHSLKISQKLMLISVFFMLPDSIMLYLFITGINENISFGRLEQTGGSESAQRRGPVGSMPDTALLAAIRGVLAASPFHGEGHRKVWARLRHGGTRTSLRRVLRLMRQHDLLAPSRVGAPRGPRSHDGTIIPGTMDTM